MHREFRQLLNMRCQWALQVARIRLNKVTARDSGTSAFDLFSITTGMTFINSIVIILISGLCSVLLISWLERKADKRKPASAQTWELPPVGFASGSRRSLVVYRREFWVSVAQARPWTW